MAGDVVPWPITDDFPAPRYRRKWRGSSSTTCLPSTPRFGGLQTLTRPDGLNCKRIPYTKIGIRYPDIEEESKKLGLKPSAHRPLWIVPIIVHDTKVVRGSFDIAKYLDNEFKDRPVVGEECSK
jgi:hypothetical protein